MRIAIVEDHAAERQLMAVMCAEYFKRTRDIGVECAVSYTHLTLPTKRIV